MIPSSRPKFFDLYTLSQSKLLEKHTLHSGTYCTYIAHIWQYPPGMASWTQNTAQMRVFYFVSFQ